ACPRGIGGRRRASAAPVASRSRCAPVTSQASRAYRRAAASTTDREGVRGSRGIASRDSHPWISSLPPVVPDRRGTEAERANPHHQRAEAAYFRNDASTNRERA